ncbi:hypothetical protein [Shewanella sp. YLB-07]|uniref:hypothetical protein n=1 Tax=Shewanella sp. YLB-07 TaxID=2601268 RepID=UPI00128BCBED|nr:hypothetical protein [Shewanella sp. YLB-07]MPY24468.1 hypothetical protein [Shewanella sp. YLB-07]
MQLLDQAVWGLYNEFATQVYYYSSWYDLNGDGIDEAVVHLVSPDACGTGGCNMYVYQWDKLSLRYQLISKTVGTSQPIYAASTKTNGWNDLIALRSGGGYPPSFMLLSFDYNNTPYPLSNGQALSYPYSLSNGQALSYPLSSEIVQSSILLMDSVGLYTNGSRKITR